ncbi:hypothetical protein ACFL08_01675 [Patescibacteria group bacterium]
MFEFIGELFGELFCGLIGAVGGGNRRGDGSNESAFLWVIGGILALIATGFGIHYLVTHKTVETTEILTEVAIEARKSEAPTGYSQEIDAWGGMIQVIREDDPDGMYIAYTALSSGKDG